MYRVMIIDDEKALRSLLKASVNWKEMGKASVYRRHPQFR